MIWKKYWHKVFQLRYEEILLLVEKSITEDPDNFYKKSIYKLFEDVTDCMENRIFQDPTHSDFKLGNTLGKSNRDWRRAKKGLPNRYRLFFKFSTNKSSIILAWLNDDKTLRKEGSKTDVYAVFKKKLDSSKIPSSTDELISGSTTVQLPEVKS